MNAAERLRASHRVLGYEDPPGHVEWCAECNADWPCDVTRLLDEYDRLRAGIRALQDNWPETIPAPMDVPS